MPKAKLDEEIEDAVKSVFVPDYDTPCDVCEQVPTVTVELDGKQVNHWAMCGPCTFGEADMVDANSWNL